MVRASYIHVYVTSYMLLNMDQRWAEELGLHTYTCTSYMLLNIDQS